MTAQRFIQNFRQSRGVLLAGAELATETLEKTLAKLGVGTVRIEEADVAGLDHNRDILFIDGDQHFNPAAMLRIGSTLPPAPAIGIVGVEAPSRLKLLAEAGVTAFLRKPVHAAAIYSALFLGVNNYRRMRAMELRIAEHDRRRHGRRYVVKAVIALVEAHGLSDDEAYAQLRQGSMRQRMGIEEFCAALLAEGDFPAAWSQRAQDHDAFGSNRSKSLNVIDSKSSERAYREKPVPTFSQPALSARLLQKTRENDNATHFDDGGRPDGDAAADLGPGSGSDQARRA